MREPESMDAQASVPIPGITGRLCVLRPVLPTDLDFVYYISTCEANNYRWRHRGTFPELSRYPETVNHGTFLQLLVLSRATGGRVGLVNAYAENLRDGWIYVGAVSDPAHRMSGVTIDGVACLVDHLFRCWDFRKVYIEAIEYNQHQFDTGLRNVASEEGRLRSHVFFDGRHWDLVTSAIYRAEWERFRQASVSRPDSPTPAAFLEALQVEFDLARPVEMKDLLLEDIGLDSIQFAELIEFVAAMAGCPDANPPEDLQSVSDLYRWLRSLQGSS